jgi:hypothetical protein
MNDDLDIVLDPNWISKAVYLSTDRLAKLDADLASMTVSIEDIEASLTDEAINSLPDFHGCVITLIESDLGEES